jgi:hypothetical protein
MVQLFAIVGVRLHGVFEAGHDAYYLPLELSLLRYVLRAVFIHCSLGIIYYTSSFISSRRKKVTELTSDPSQPASPSLLPYKLYSARIRIKILSV